MKIFLKEALGWGFVLWFIGYILGIILIFLVPSSMIGWIITPIGVLITVWVLLKKVSGNNLKHYLVLSFVWTAIAILFDYLFIVLLFHPTDNYYKPDVFLYYSLTFILPLAVGWYKTKK